jgi:hypothetical protein
MKKITCLTGFAVAALLMLLPVVHHVNHAISNGLAAAPVQIADGTPGPPKPPDPNVA